MAAHLVVTRHQGRIDLVFAKLGRSVERGEIGASASENRDAVSHRSTAVQRDAFTFEKRNYLAPVQVARQREHVWASPAHVVDHLARIGLAAEIGKVAGYY